MAHSSKEYMRKYMRDYRKRKKEEINKMIEVLVEVIQDLYLYHVISEAECKRLLKKLERHVSSELLEK